MAYDLVIKNGMLVDGTGAAARRADVAVSNVSIIAAMISVQLTLTFRKR